MFEPQLFHESINDAMRELVAALGGTKQVGHRMRPEMTPDHAGRWLSDCINADRREHLTPEQLLWLLAEGRRANLHSVIDWIATTSGYTRPSPVEPEDERTALQREFIEATKRQERILSRLESLTPAPAATMRKVA